MARVWIIVCVLFLTGVVLAALNVTSGDAAGAAADASDGSLPLDGPIPDDTLFQPGMVRPATQPAAAQPDRAIPMTSAHHVARQREADALIDRLLLKIRADKEARRKARAEAKRTAGN